MVNGIGSKVTANTANVGVFGGGSLTVANGGVFVINGIGGSIAAASGSNGSVTISGIGSQLITSGFCVGCGGLGVLTLNSGAVGSSATGLSIGEGLGASGKMTMTGPGTKWTTNAGTVIVGDNGTGALSVQNGATFSTSSDLIVGQSAKGSLIITSAGQVSDVNATVGAISGSTGTVLVDAATWTNTGLLDIGTNGTGIVTVADGGHLSAGDLTIGSLGSLIIDPAIVDVLGNFDLAPGGVLTLDIGGTAPGLFSQLDISGSALFQGTIDFKFIDGFAPTTGESFDLINALLGADFSEAKFQVDGLESGFHYTDTFSHGEFTLVAQDDGVSTSATPEPRSVWLLATALVLTLSMGALRKKVRSTA
jgi:T5SS/PEP-CTERM-associated repeat protein